MKAILITSLAVVLLSNLSYGIIEVSIDALTAVQESTTRGGDAVSTVDVPYINDPGFNADYSIVGATTLVTRFTFTDGLYISTPEDFSTTLSFRIIGPSLSGGIFTSSSPTTASISGNAAAEALATPTGNLLFHYLASTLEGTIEIGSSGIFNLDAGTDYRFDEITVTADIQALNDAIFTNWFLDPASSKFTVQTVGAFYPENWISSGPIIPEPSTIALGLALGALVFARFYRRRA